MRQGNSRRHLMLYYPGLWKAGGKKHFFEPIESGWGCLCLQRGLGKCEREPRSLALRPRTWEAEGVGRDSVEPSGWIPGLCPGGRERRHCGSLPRRFLPLPGLKLQHKPWCKPEFTLLLWGCAWKSERAC